MAKTTTTTDAAVQRDAQARYVKNRLAAMEVIDAIRAINHAVKSKYGVTLFKLDSENKGYIVDMTNITTLGKYMRVLANAPTADAVTKYAMFNIEQAWGSLVNGSKVFIVNI